MENTSAKILPGQVATPTEIKRPGKDTKILSSVPGQEKPLICKLLSDPRSGSAYVAMGYYGYQVGPDPKKHSRKRPSLASLKKLAADPEKEEFWAIHNKIKELKKTHNEKHPAVVALDTQKKLFSAQECGWFFFVEPNSDTIKCVKLPPDAINQLFGKEASAYKPAYVSILDTAAKKGQSPYDLTKETGWLKMYKTGEGLGTRYHITLDTAEVERKDAATGEMFTTPMARSHTIHTRLVTEGVDLSEYPNPLEFEARNAFTVDETNAFIASVGTAIPERFFPNNNGPREVEDGDEGISPATHEPAALASLDDIPF